MQDMPQRKRVRNLVTAPIRAGRHLAIWVVWQSTGVTLVRR
jgi:hypothetical protein